MLTRCEQTSHGAYDDNWHLNCPDCADRIFNGTTVQLTFEPTFKGHSYASIDLEVDVIGDWDGDQLCDWDITDCRVHRFDYPDDTKAQPKPVTIDKSWPLFKQAREFLKRPEIKLDIEDALTKVHCEQHPRIAL